MGKSTRKGVKTDRIFGLIMMIAAALSVAAMAHHPTDAHGGGVGDYVHGAMIVTLSLLFLGFARFSMVRGMDDGFVLGAIIAYAVSLAAHIGAATINGFLVPALAARGADAVGHDIFVLCWEANQALAKLGVFATGAAFVCWSVNLLFRGEGRRPLLGAAGLVAGAAPAIALAAGLLTMDVSGAFAVYAIHGVWAFLVGVETIRSRPRAVG